MVAEEGVEVPGRTNVAAGTVLYKVLWKNFHTEIATWEDEDSIHQDFIDTYEECLHEENAQNEDEESGDEQY